MRIDLGDGHALEFAEYNGEPRVGATVYHSKPDGTECAGFIAFEGRAWANVFRANPIPTWQVLQDEPLTLEPSILCRACGDHGHIRNGKWDRAPS